MKLRGSDWQKRRSAALAIGASAALVASACALAGIGAQASGAAASKSSVKMMVIYTTNTSLTNEPETLAGAQVAAKYINAAGGINGHPIQIIGCNDQQSADVAAACARTAVSDHVIAEVGRSSVTGDNIDPILTAAKIPMIGLDPDVPLDYTSNNSFPFVGGGVVEYMGLVQELAYEGKTNITIAALDTPVIDQVLQGMKAELNKRLVKTPSGKVAKLAGNVQWAITTSDYTPIAESIKSQNADGVGTVGNAQGDLALQSAALQLGISIPFTNTAGNFTNALMAQVPNGFLVDDSLPPAQTSNNAGVKKFRAEMAAGSKAGIANAGAANLDDDSLDAWLSVYGAADVARTMKTASTGPDLLAQLKKTKKVNIEGVLTNWDPAAIGTGPKPFPDWTNPNLYFLKIENGKPVLLTSKTFNMATIVKKSFS
jgi:ABC-type branched-subunit amino acid transport system substrate-binding protein